VLETKPKKISEPKVTRVEKISASNFSAYRVYHQQMQTVKYDILVIFGTVSRILQHELASEPKTEQLP